MIESKSQDAYNVVSTAIETGKVYDELK